MTFHIHEEFRKIKKLGNNFNIRTAFKTNNTLRSILTHTKPINKEQNEKNCIYQIPCQCGKHYIGETSRPLDVRIKEHKNYVVYSETMSFQLNPTTPQINSGVHGGLVVLEPSFNGDTMATALGIPASKNIIRRHLTAELEALILPARYVIFCQMDELQSEAARVISKHNR
ncbi:hypothetical protein NQ315_013800 [Exocentrus adspersus]|uniref:GIY-YIG homing endonuclease n=1 Tax=Exocentrus adspersus TaxID=1586481 RepID=A0AAV8V6C4_9CUCU|nr:hypothetical protein NQ315_013800 [Exocentrus adspersus]